MPVNLLQEIFYRLLANYGPRNWWPGETTFEICAGAILTQNTNWNNVEKAIANLKKADALSLDKIASLKKDELAELIRPTGYYNLKASRLQEFIFFLKQEHQGSFERLFSHPWQQTRVELLNIKGIGPETADSILLYAGNKPSFVVDSYTRRIYSRLGIVTEGISYDELRKYFMDHLPHELYLFNEYHALIVELGKQVCRKSPKCSHCCLSALCPVYIS